MPSGTRRTASVSGADDARRPELDDSLAPASPELDPAAQRALDRWNPAPSFKRRLYAKVVVAACKALVQNLNSLELRGVEVFEEARRQDRALLTFSNHVSLFDDPWLVATFSGSDWHRARWCATDALNFFSNPISARLFSAGKGVPIVRGAGLDQPGMRFLRERLREGEWVHIFPEGGRTRDPEHLRTPLKTGLAHLVKATRPLLLPFHHTGMEQVLPIGAKLPRLANHLTLEFGTILDSDAVPPGPRDPDAPPELPLADRSVADITSWAEARLLELEKRQRDRARDAK
ncbi:MAG: lysophospholipid acyltransferase family protein [Myxococcota bacterium]